MLFAGQTTLPSRKMSRVGPSHPDDARASKITEHKEAQDEPQNMCLKP